MLSILSTLLVPALLAPAAHFAPAALAQDPTFEERLATLAERIEEERVSGHIPGIALAVVKDGKVVFAQGFGLADVEQGLAVKPETIFAIGSSTKAFTATMLGMLQDDGKLNFDDPITKYLPYFELPIEGPDEAGDSTVTLRDLLCHRTGFTRMSMLWGTGEVAREQILHTAVSAEPWAGFREKFLYNNVMFLAAGTAGGVAAESTWDELVQQRILIPLGMTSTTLSVTEAQADARLALGYEWNTDTESFDHKRMLDLHSIGPAGSINSNVLDMAKWLSFQMADGQHAGEQLISESALHDTWTANIAMSENMEYGMGWMLQERLEMRVIEHGGNIDGFGAQVAFMPEAGIGYVLLTNITATPLQQGSISIVFDALLGDPKPEAVQVSADDLSSYVGNYTANFATFKDATFEVLVQNEHLAVDVPGQMTFELYSPDEEGKWYFRLTDQIAISFDRDDSGRPVGLRMHQSGMTFELPREGTEVPVEIPLAELEPFLGKYHNEALDTDMRVLIQNNRLALDVPDQMIFELHAPDAEQKRQFRVTDKVSVRFNEDASGQVSTLTMFEKGGVREFQRLEATKATAERDLPTLEELFALRQIGGRALLLAKHGTIRTTGHMRAAQSGVEGSYVFEARLDPLAYRMEIDFGPFGKMAFGSDGTNAWAVNPARGYDTLNGTRLRQVLRAHPSLIFGDWRETFDSVTVESREELDGRAVLNVKAQYQDLSPRRMFVDAENGHVLRMDFIYTEGMMRLPIRATFSDYRMVDGVSVWHTSVERNDASGRSIQTLESIDLGVELAANFHEYKGEE